MTKHRKKTSLLKKQPYRKPAAPKKKKPTKPHPGMLGSGLAQRAGKAIQGRKAQLAAAERKATGRKR